MAFKTKTINCAKTVGAKLKEARRKKKITLEDAEEKTKVRSKYLKAIEADNWNEFPSRVYLLGFIRRYADFLNLNSKEILEEFKFEFGQFRDRPIFKPNRTLNKNFWDNIIITPRMVIGTLAVLLVTLIIGYTSYLVGKYSIPPTLEITAPENKNLNQKDTVIEGKVSDPTAIVIINNENIAVNENGTFAQKVELVEGINYFDLKAKSRLGKQSNTILKIVYNIPSS